MHNNILFFGKLGLLCEHYCLRFANSAPESTMLIFKLKQLHGQLHLGQNALERIPRQFIKIKKQLWPLLFQVEWCPTSFKPSPVSPKALPPALHSLENAAGNCAEFRIHPLPEEEEGKEHLWCHWTRLDLGGKKYVQNFFFKVCGGTLRARQKAWGGSQA